MLQRVMQQEGRRMATYGGLVAQHHDTSKEATDSIQRNLEAVWCLPALQVLLAIICCSSFRAALGQGLVSGGACAHLLAHADAASVVWHGRPADYIVLIPAGQSISAESRKRAAAPAGGGAGTKPRGGQPALSSGGALCHAGRNAQRWQHAGAATPG